MQLSKIKIGTSAFIIVLLFMPIGHALMVFNEKFFGEFMYLGAIKIGILGFISLFIGVVNNDKMLKATLLGFIGAILIWTGWVEFSFVWIAEKLQVLPYMENGEVATKPEYLVMLSSIGLLATILVVYLFKNTQCQFFNWFQKVGRYKHHLKSKGITKPMALTVFLETIIIIWAFYILLLLVYDEDLVGDKHPLTYIVAFGSLFWSIYLFLKLIKIQKFDYAIRYAVPTVVIFWNFIEVAGRWDLFKEIWVHPFEHWIENSIILALLIVFILVYTLDSKREKRLRLS